uniref:Uncharacterized protein n=3 Tax=Ceratitis capitata TaxID=7213 RepID=W8BTJ9_CERCA
MSYSKCETRVRATPTSLNLPLFLTGRTRFKDDQMRKVSNYITKKKQFFSNRCNNEKDVKTRAVLDLRNSVAVKPTPTEACSDLHITKLTRILKEDKPWYLPPNLYNTTKVPFAERRGYLGAYWPKTREAVGKFMEQETPESVRSQALKKEHWQFYEKPDNVELLFAPANKHKGVFLTNARNRRATARSMISNPSAVYRSPSEPSAATYFPQQHELLYNVSPPTLEPKPNPHLFLPHTSVADKGSTLIPRHTSFRPAVGRYETRFAKICGCGGKILAPDLQLMVEREKRFKFRRLPYKKIDTHKYCSPDWSHVEGRGFRRLFRTPTGKPITLSKTIAKEKSKEKSKDKQDKLIKQLTLYADSKYINMINAPQKEPISIHSGGIASKPVGIHFNCMTKRKVRRQLRINKKIVFNSGSDRFPELDIRPVQLTARKLEDLKNSLPRERQLRDHPVMRKSIGQIKSKLYATPAHMRPAYEPNLRKRDFKFRPLPEPKVLITEKQLRPSDPELEFFFNKPIRPEDFMKTGIMSESKHSMHEGEPVKLEDNTPKVEVT